MGPESTMKKTMRENWKATHPRRKDILFDFLTKTGKKGPSTEQLGSTLGSGGTTSSMKDSEDWEAGWTLRCWLYEHATHPMQSHGLGP